MMGAESDNEVYLDFCSESRGEILNIYIHGYSAANNDDDKLFLKNKVSSLPGNATDILLFWPSGNIWSMDFKKAVFSFLRGGVVPGALMTVGEKVDDYLSVERDIPRLVYEVLYKINKFISLVGEYKYLNFFGHSLGVRLIIEAMLKLPDDFKLLRVKNLVFMGGARKLDIEECQMLLNTISGDVFNIYSDGDRILQFIKPDLEKCIGRYPIQYPNSDRVKNIGFHHLGHLDYWDNLNGIVRYLDFDCVNSKKIIPVGNGVKEPHCFAVNDIVLYLPLYHASLEEKKILAHVLRQKSSASISQEETCAITLTHELQLMGGDSIANMARGHGVCYREILYDAAMKLDISNPELLGFVSLEETIFNKVISLIKNSLDSSSKEERNKYSDILSELDLGVGIDGMTINTGLSLKSFILISDFIARNVTIGSASLLNLSMNAFSGPAFSVTIPSIMLLHYIRKRVALEFGEEFLFQCYSEF
ncbi:hypothetical protein Dd1591_3728 [Dickeya chrysanthemi Ech1591]|uniref:DUF726 domain-containing protein n=1 Tax=Dickeya chrysanthemi (strain Ech1591) TaxID=561229 RepID=C6CLM9_DICC1|nr:DUF726 domain-containing protein [Dickeya chrysanthemi]ACT08531.1 hypothetical protein Dd1591_3728 [Dickeya chrysanthemi Ech1591]